MEQWVHIAIWIGIAIVAIGIFWRYVLWTVQKSIEEMSKLAGDPIARQAALKELDEKIIKKPNDPGLRYNRACLRRFNGDYAGVVEDMAVKVKKPSKRCPDEDWADYSDALLHCNRLDEAETAAKKAIELDRDPDSLHQALLVKIALLKNDEKLAAEKLTIWQSLSSYDQPINDWNCFLYQMHKYAFDRAFGSPDQATQAVTEARKLLQAAQQKYKEETASPSDQTDNNPAILQQLKLEPALQQLIRGIEQ